jgi:UDP-galactopyranose mutase
MRAVIVGAGLSGLTAAALLRKDGWDVSIFDTKPHLGGLCYDEDRQGIRVHQYGAHVYHTDDMNSWVFLNSFVPFMDFRVRVQANTIRGMIPIPYNDVSESITGEMTDNEIVDMVFKPYSRKQWGAEWGDLPESIRSRVKVRRQGDCPDYHLDTWSGVPKTGYADLFGRMADGCHLFLGEPKGAWIVPSGRADLTIYTGPIDEYFGFSLGKLEYRSMNWVFRSSGRREVQIINECNKVPYTRSCDHSWWNPVALDSQSSIIGYEYPSAVGEPMYPMDWGESARMASAYRVLSKKEHVVFCGRLAEYRYLDMDKVVMNARNAVTPFLKPKEIPNVE